MASVSMLIVKQTDSLSAGTAVIGRCVIMSDEVASSSEEAVIFSSCGRTRPIG